jgi:outer membrane protein OmpA-like peptidoglycan-associated protein
MKKTFLILIVCLLVFYSAHGQNALTTKSSKAERLYKEALDKIDRYDYETAVQLLKDAAVVDDKFAEAYLMLGETYSDLGKDSLAIISFRKFVEINPDVFPPGIANLARLEWNNGYYKEGYEHVTKFLGYPNIKPNILRAAQYLKNSCEYAMNAINKQVPFKPQNMGAAINDKYDQYWPSLSADGETFVFTEAIPINPSNPEAYMNRQEDFYISHLGTDSIWQQSRPIGAPLNTSGNEGAQSLSADGKIMVFTGCNRKGGVGLCDLYISYKNGDQWSTPKNMGEPVNSTAKETQPSISPDGRTIYFSSNRKGTYGGLDLWKTILNDSGKWTTPVNLGDSINTPFDEQSPFIHNDNKTLYFSSNGWPGFGNFDLFVSRKISDSTWTKPMNLGYPINTHFVEEGLIVNAKGNIAYYSSTRQGFGGRDIFYFELYKKARPTPVSYMKGMVYNSETHQPLKARFELIDLKSGSSVMDAYSSEDGTFLICIPSGKSYALNVSKTGYLFYSDNFTMGNGDFIKPFTKDIPLDPIKAGNKVVLKNIFFDHDSYVLKDESKIELSKLLILLKDNKTVRIEISGHTDNTGQKDYNLKLSENRAQAVYNYLISKGITPERLTWKGFGDSMPILPNDNSEGRAANRRTEFKVVGL